MTQPVPSWAERATPSRTATQTIPPCRSEALLSAVLVPEQALATFDGTLLLVTHDRRMLSTVRSTRHWALDAGRVSEQPATAQPRP